MNVQQYLEKRRELELRRIRYREICMSCRQPDFACYCSELQPFDPGLRFVILIHPIETKRRIATGRMSHLCLANSELIQGQDYSDNARVNEILSEKDSHSVILYPGRTSVNLTVQSTEERRAHFPSDRKLTVFVIDGTWATARRMVRLSRNLIGLPRICFTPPTPSNFRVRKQPAPGCYSTIEAVHHTIELLGDSFGFETASRRHDSLLRVFDFLVEQQLSYIQKPRLRRTENKQKSSIEPSESVHPS